MTIGSGPFRKVTLTAPVAPIVPRLRRVVHRLGADSIFNGFRWFRRVYGGRWSYVTGCGGERQWALFAECPAKARHRGCSDVMCVLRRAAGGCGSAECRCELYP